MTTLINADTVVGGAIITGDASGELGLQAAGSTKLTVAAGGVTLASPLATSSGGTGTSSTTFVNLATNVTGTLPVANGGTGAASLTANNVLLGNGTSAVQAVAPGTNGNVLMSNGTTWTSAAPTGGNWVLISTGSFGGTSTIDFNGSLTSTYDLYFVEGAFTTASSGAAVAMYSRFFNNSGTIVTATNYSGNNWGGENNTTTMRWNTSYGYIPLHFNGYFIGGVNTFSLQMYINRSPYNTNSNIYGAISGVYSTWAAPQWFSWAYGTDVQNLNLGGIRIYDGNVSALNGTLRLWGWKKT